MDYSTIYPKALARLFPDRTVRAEAEAILSQYSANEGLRVKTAILKVAGSDLEEIRRCTKAACADFRDVLSWAEYPAQLKAGFGVNESSLVRQDKKQYQAWIDGVMGVQQPPERDK